MNLPTHVLDHLAATTGVDYRAASRKARRSPCRGCSAWTLRGLDDDLLAEDVRVDVIPLTLLGEAVARRQGFGSWQLSASENGLQLNRRDRYSIAEKPAGTLPRADVVPGHSCGRRWLPPCIARSRLPRAGPASAFRGDPPF
jgi:hypothetical protein